MNGQKTWTIVLMTTILICAAVVCLVTYCIDPYMHYHMPIVEKYWYSLDNQRSQNDGITKNFAYDAIVTGTSITENFKASEIDRVFHVTSIKIPYSGGLFKEINDNLIVALQTHPDIKYVFRSLDRYKILSDKNSMRDDLGEYPVYLYDNNIFNDVHYLMNRDILYTRIWQMVKSAKDTGVHGITSFDDYSYWGEVGLYGPKVGPEYGPQRVLSYMFKNRDDRFTISNEPSGSLTEAEKEIIRGNIEQNVTSLADQYPNTEFYYFLPPYSGAFWGERHQQSSLDKSIQIEQYAIELIVPHENIHLFAWNRFDITDDLNNYKDNIHYGEWINSWMLAQMKEDSGRITAENYLEYINEEKRHYEEFDYNLFFSQKDYEYGADYYAAALINEEITGASPLYLDADLLAGAAKNGVRLFDNENILAMAEHIEDHYYNGQSIPYPGEYDYFRFTVSMGETYHIAPGLRFLCKENTESLFSETHEPYDFTPDFSGEVYLTLNRSEPGWIVTTNRTPENVLPYDMLREQQATMIDCIQTNGSEESGLISPDADFTGIKFAFDATDYRAISFWGRKVSGDVNPSLSLYYSNGELACSMKIDPSKLDYSWHQYVFNIEQIRDKVEVVLSGGGSSAADYEYIFSNVVIY